jgi:hypothetical protein
MDVLKSSLVTLMIRGAATYIISTRVNLALVAPYISQLRLLHAFGYRKFDPSSDISEW